jgi:hypothetical protein
MNLDRSLLVLLVLTMFARVIHAPMPLCQMLGIASALQVWRLHPKAIGADASATVSLG